MKIRAILFTLLFAILPAGTLARPTAGLLDDDTGDAQKVERAINVDSAVAVSLCVASGNISVHGWDRSEVRVRSADAVKIELAHAPQSPSNSSIKKL